MKSRSKSLLAAALLFTALGVSACTDNERYEAIKEDPAPGLLTLHERDVDADNAWTVSRNENWRMFWRDIGKTMYTDRPSRLTRETIPQP